MNGKIQNSPIRIASSPLRPPRSLQPHHIRHLISGTLVFLLGIAANETIMHLRRQWPRTVRWSATEVQRDYVPPTSMPPEHMKVDIGMCEDGSFVWRPRNAAAGKASDGAVKIGEKSKSE
jgi:hypothetical protein